MAKKKYIHVNQLKIRSNKKHGTDDPVLSVKVGDRNLYGRECEIKGPSKLIHRPEKPLSCGARVWIETRSQVVLDGRDVE